MKLLVVHWGHAGGGPLFTYKMAQALAEVEGVELFGSYSTVADNRADWESLGAPSFTVRTYCSAKEFLLGVPRWAKAVVGLRRFIRRNGIDAVYSGMLSLWQSIPLRLVLPSDVIYASSIHDATDHPGEEHPLKLLCRRNELSRADLVVTHSAHVEQTLSRQLGPEKCSLVIPHPTEAKTSRPRRYPDHSPMVLGFFGRLAAYKGLELYVESLRKLYADGVPVRGAVYGNGNVSAELVEGSRDFVDWHIGWVPPSEVDAIFDAFDIVALPYTEASQSGVLPQAIGRGIPVAATPVGGLKEQVEECRGGTTADEVSAPGFATAVERLVRDAALYESAASRGLLSAQAELSWDRAARKLAAHLSELLPGRRAERYETV